MLEMKWEDSDSSPKNNGGGTCHCSGSVGLVEGEDEKGERSGSSHLRRPENMVPANAVVNPRPGTTFVNPFDNDTSFT